MFNIPNILTMFRIFLVPLFVAAMVMPGQSARIGAFVIFCLAGISDALDGFAARKLRAGSDFGKMLDPIADKLLVGVALMLVADGMMDRYSTLIPALIILSREILVSGLREFLAGLDVSVPVSRIAKTKTAIQMIAIGAMILRPLANGFVPGTPASAYSTFAYAALWLAAALTVYTGYVYFRAGLAHVRPASATHGEPV
jgi:cardiolipin synthase